MIITIVIWPHHAMKTFEGKAFSNVVGFKVKVCELQDVFLGAKQNTAGFFYAYALRISEVVYCQEAP